MKEERTRNADKTNNWATGSKTNANFSASSCRDDHTLMTPERKSSLENIGIVWTIENLSAVKGPICKKNKIPDYSKKWICTFTLCTMVSEAIPIIMMSWISDLSIFNFTMERQKNGGGHCSLYLVHKYAEMLNNTAFKRRLVDLKDK